MTSTLATPVAHGRHRLGRAGLVHVTSFVQVAYRGLLTSWLRPGKHRPYIYPRPTTTTASPAPAV